LSTERLCSTGSTSAAIAQTTLVRLEPPFKKSGCGKITICSTRDSVEPGPKDGILKRGIRPIDGSGSSRALSAEFPQGSSSFCRCTPGATEPFLLYECGCKRKDKKMSQPETFKAERNIFSPVSVFKYSSKDILALSPRH
jgi:hypothetical protein